MDKKIELIKLARKGDKKALCQLIKDEQPSIYSMLYYLKKDKYDLNDIMQDVLIKIANKIHQLRNPENFKMWLNQIILNSYYDYMRKNKKLKMLDLINEEDNLQSNKLSPQDKILNSELDIVIKNSIENLPMHYKIPITLREIAGLSYNDISSLTKTSIGTVKSRISRARSIIQDDIDRYTND